ncbi:uncharacterized protein E5676_scaffold27861G00010 [Cucumis melo var. makuwa]|uniref:PHD-type zinc finger plants domain-containing protein n=1 Tax=Cucumis melo var. makuwa TaxID=1194695 RepID=A0A5D3BDU2_CUCMM|nr:uncharacterized protein E6C27_scaffold14518G00010 [Cucumis melo var. makuwa]TYJ96635.1 uncharacterized protein E5676_scaffold27861G00010 [Cucumis melo var. makuwa]
MCGDIGFPDKLFHCNKYCSNYYSESAEPIEVCDWCQCEGRSTSSRSHGSSSSRRPPSTGTNATGIMSRSEYSSDKLIKHHHDDSPTEKGKHGGAGSTPSPRPTTRRYKLLKDVMC